MKFKFLVLKGCIILISLVISSCQKDNSAKNSQAKLSAAVVTQPAQTTTSIISADSTTDTTTNILTVNWDNDKNRSIYTLSAAVSDFGNISGTGWDLNQAYITAGKSGLGCRATLMPNTLVNEGLYGSINLPVATEYQMDYDMEFDPNFNWGFGGKVGFGFLVGDGNTGGNAAWDGNGGSLRIMWFSPNISSNRVYFQPYLYYKDMNGGPSSGDIYGDGLGKTYPTEGALVKGKWYHVHMLIKSNSGDNTDGRAQIVIDGNTVLDQAIRWTTNDTKRFINTLTFNTFRGGGDSTWETATTDYVYYDNLIVQKVN